jgi:hypothetical protein
MPKITQVPTIPVPNNPQPVSIRWREWGAGFNSEDDPVDLPVGSSKLVNNFDITKKGKLVDVNGHTALLTNIPASLSIKRIFQYKVTKPSAQTITIVIGTLGTLWKVYAVNATLFVRPGDVSGWRDLTEYVAGTAAATTATTNTRFDLGALSQVADAQRGYFMINLTQGTSSIITASAFIAGPDLWDLTTANSMGAAAAPGDSILVMRYPLIGYFASGAVTDYDLTVTNVEDISFSLDNDVLRINFGSSSDQERGFWFGYIDRFHRYAQGTSRLDNTTSNYAAYNTGGWYCENQDLLRATAAALTATAPGYGAPLPADTYYFKVSFMYDGNQEGPPNTFASGTQAIVVPEGSGITFSLAMAMYAHTIASGSSSYVQGGGMSGYPMFTSFRITDALFYLSTDKSNFYLVSNETLASDSIITAGTSTPLLTALASYISGIEWAGRGGEYSDRTGFGSYPIGDVNSTSVGVGTVPKCVGFTDVQTMVRGRRFVGSIRQQIDNDYEQFIFRIAGAQAHSNGTWQNDVFGLGQSEHIDISTKQADKVMGLEELDGGLVIIKENSLHSLDFGGGNMESWTIRASNLDLGAVSKRSIKRVPGGIIFGGKENVYFFDGINVIPLADSWRTEYQAATPSSAFASYYPLKDQYRLTFPSTKKTYILYLKTGGWVTDSTIDATPVDIFDTVDGNVVWVSAAQAYKMDQSTGVNNVIGSLTTSIMELDPTYVWKLNRVFMTFKETTTGIILKFYTNHGATLIYQGTFTGTGAVISLGKIASAEVTNIQAVLATATNADYSTEIHEIRADLIPVRKRRGAI